jgi:hypothetical protein
MTQYNIYLKINAHKKTEFNIIYVILYFASMPTNISWIYPLSPSLSLSLPPHTHTHTHITHTQAQQPGKDTHEIVDSR